MAEKYIAILGRQAEISVAELKALFLDVRKINEKVAEFKSLEEVNIDRLGGSLKVGIKLKKTPLEFLKDLPEGKITLGVSDYSKRATKKTATIEALKLKKILGRHGRSVRVVENREAVLSTATSLHNGLAGKNPKKVELVKVENEWFKIIGVQDIEAYAKRDQARPARDAKVGMLPPKLAQILINLCGPLKAETRILDPFCGTGVVLQEARLMGYEVYGTDINERMIEYTRKNLEWLGEGDFRVEVGDATSFKWEEPIGAVACEGYLGRPMSNVPAEIKLKTEKQECSAIILGFLRNLAEQVKAGVPVVIAMPAWLDKNGEYSRLEILDEIEKMGYNVENKSREGLLYHREGQVVARDIIILRKE